MTDLHLLAHAYHTIMAAFVHEGRAPHYTELGRSLGVNPDEARRIQRDLLASPGLPAWTHPDTDYIAAFAPFSNIPTHHRISVDGREKWYGVCGPESLAVSWLFPTRRVTIDTLCLDCADPITVQMQDGEVLSVIPDTAIGHVNLPRPRWSENYAYA
ncbi:MAG: hypothetical protein HY216_03555 [Candidatus Rokubacteria bacterium]|nr:hypothetical protein [Candidatus Rokubacteria bacterium]